MYCAEGCIGSPSDQALVTRRVCDEEGVLESSMGRFLSLRDLVANRLKGVGNFRSNLHHLTHTKRSNLVVVRDSRIVPLVQLPYT